MKDRRVTFKRSVLQLACLLFLVYEFFEACSADSLEEDTGDGTSTGDGGSSDNGYTKNGSTYH